MLFLGYWSLWFLLGFFLMLFGKIRIVEDQIFTITIFSLILAIPSWLVHFAFFSN